MRDKERFNDFYPAYPLQRKQASKSKEVVGVVVLLVLSIIMAKAAQLGKFDRIFPVPENIIVSSWKQIQIQPGDTLWGFATQYNDVNPHILVYIIQKKNNISISQFIHPGEKILIPSAVKYRWDNKISFPRKLWGIEPGLVKK